MNLVAKYRLIASPITLNGKPAAIAGAECPFAVVRSMDGRLYAEFAWFTAERIVAAGGEFKI